MRLIDTRVILGLSLWILGFALMTAGWLVDALFEGWGRIPSKVLYKLGALIVAVPVIVLLWRASRLLYVPRIDIVLGINNAASFLTEAMKSL